MTDFLLRDLDPAVYTALKRRAELAGRSIQAEIHATLRDAVPLTRAEALALAAELRDETRGRPSLDSAELIREARDES